jgi:hypothetical protein
MRKTRRATAVLIGLIGAFIVGLAACSADVTAPTAPEAPEIAAPTEPPSHLLGLDLDLGETVSEVGDVVSGVLASLTVFPCETAAIVPVTRTIGSGGGTIYFGRHSLYVPPGALKEPVSITATVKGGSEVKVNFEPHGLRFERSAVLTLSYAHCPTRPVQPKLVYVSDLLSILERSRVNLDDEYGRRVIGKLDHFSGYATAE